VLLLGTALAAVAAVPTAGTVRAVLDAACCCTREYGSGAGLGCCCPLPLSWYRLPSNSSVLATSCSMRSIRCGSKPGLLGLEGAGERYCSLSGSICWGCSASAA